MSTVDTTVGVAMTPEVLGIVPGAPLEVALRMMVETGVRHLPVVDRGRCVGLLHESDVLWRLWSTAGAAPRAVMVARTPVVSVTVSDDMRTVARRMVDAETDAAVVTEDGRIVGIVTVTDLLHRLAEG
ncbi:HPP family protein [Actinophytocola sp.]|uniref:CBS domain-containing protein n=1 Tax=Actinophytocola sp. TaxID=1872138 RepID=UPI002D2E6600|nr:CBS domain-containing protein [Actinophytocola sp.]HYQ63993.1 CBS domain-containing protein [Actinophytocola sp.]